MTQALPRTPTAAPGSAIPRATGRGRRPIAAPPSNPCGALRVSFAPSVVHHGRVHRVARSSSSARLSFLQQFAVRAGPTFVGLGKLPGRCSPIRYFAGDLIRTVVYAADHHNPVTIGLALMFAVMLNPATALPRGGRFFRAAIFLPAVLSAGA